MSGRGKVLWQHHEESGYSCQPGTCPDLEDTASLSYHPQPPASGEGKLLLSQAPDSLITKSSVDRVETVSRLQGSPQRMGNGEWGERLGVGALYWVRGYI